MNEKWVGKQKDTLESRKPRVLYIDIETSYAVGTFWGNRMYKTDIINLLLPPKVIMVGWMWDGDKKPSAVCLKDFKGYKPGVFNIDDRPVVEKAWELLNEADYVIGQNSDAFDIRLLNARFWHYGIQAPSVFESEDTKKKAKKVFYIPSYKLKEMLKYRGLPQKKDPGGIGGWERPIETGKGWEHMREYCKNDVAVLPPFRDSMLSFWKIKTPANIITRLTDHCPNPTCLSKEYMKNGKAPTRTGWAQRRVCRPCGTPYLGEVIKDGSSIKIKTQ